MSGYLFVESRQQESSETDLARRLFVYLLVRFSVKSISVGGSVAEYEALG